MNHHLKCNLAFEENVNSLTEKHSWYPTRLIDVQTASKGYVCLCWPSKDQKASGPYVTLSHCWGSGMFKKLTSETLKEFEAGIDIADLPLNFQQAIEITRTLRFRYIWIDSLCILQDQLNDDWQHEAAEMDKIYSNSTLNIAATSAKDSTEGLYRKRPCRTMNFPRLSLHKPGSPPRKYRVIDNSMWKNEIQNAPLISRAWVLQERLLAARVLHFGQRQLVWECCEKKAMELLPEGLLPGRNVMTREFKNLEPSSFIAQDAEGGGQSQYEEKFYPYIFWTHLVETYSKARLSYTSDKLIALSGIAKRFSKKTECDYHAGLWRTSIEYQLLWHVARSGRPNSAPAYRAPSWSWASVDGETFQPRWWKSDAIIANVTGVHVNTTFSKYGTLDIEKHAELSICGTLREVTLGLRRSHDKVALISTWIQDVDGKEITGEYNDRSEALDPEVRLDYDLDTLDEAIRLFCMPIYHDKNAHELRGLILSLDPVTGFYKRAGTFWSWMIPRINVLVEHNTQNYTGSGTQTITLI